MYNIYFTTPVESAPMTGTDSKFLEFPTLEEAIAYCESYTKGREPYCCDDTPEHNNHFHLEVLPEDCIVTDEEGNDMLMDALFTTDEYYSE